MNLGFILPGVFKKKAGYAIVRHSLLSLRRTLFRRAMPAFCYFFTKVVE